MILCPWLPGSWHVIVLTVKSCNASHKPCVDGEQLHTFADAGDRQGRRHLISRLPKAPTVWHAATRDAWSIVQLQARFIAKHYEEEAQKP